jgi:hypothetical protein
MPFRLILAYRFHNGKRQAGYRRASKEANIFQKNTLYSVIPKRTQMYVAGFNGIAATGWVVVFLN